MEYKGLIAAAGRSSRMEGFKPLMELNGFPMIQMTVQSLRNAGIRDITVVIGCRAEEMAETLRPLDVAVVENADYAATDMLCSICMGLSGITDADGVFFLPGDVPLVSPASMKKIKDKLAGLPAGIQALQPVVGDRKVHPPVLLPEGYGTVLRYDGEGGLGGAFSSMRVEHLELADDGALADADRRSDFERMSAYAKEHKGVSFAVCRKMYDEVGLPAHIRAHCQAVGSLAGEIAKKLTAHGACLDIELCRSGGYLHDLCRLSARHETMAGAFLRERGYRALARVVEAHKGFTKEPDTVCEESVIVCLADKLLQEDRRVSLGQRYKKALEKDRVKPRILRDIRILHRLSEEYEVITGERL